MENETNFVTFYVYLWKNSKIYIQFDFILKRRSKRRSKASLMPFWRDCRHSWDILSVKNGNLSNICSRFSSNFIKMTFQTGLVYLKMKLQHTLKPFERIHVSNLKIWRFFFHFIYWVLQAIQALLALFNLAYRNFCNFLWKFLNT